MIKVLLLGATGKLGRHVLKELANYNYVTAALIRDLSSIKTGNLVQNVKLFEGDITVKDSLYTAVEWADAVINCSGYVSYKKADAAKLNEINVKGVEHIVHACSRFNKRLIHTSSAVLYGSTERPVFFREDQRTEVGYKSAYAVSKTKAEEIILASGIPKVILRPGSLISKEKSTLKSLYDFYKNGFVPGLTGGASFSLVQDAARAYIPVLELLLQDRSGQSHIFNLGGNNLTIKEIFQHFQRADKRNTIFIPDAVMRALSIINDSILLPIFNTSLITRENYQTGSRFTYLDSGKAARVLGYTITPFEDSLEEIIR